MKNTLRHLVVLGAGALATLYLVNPGAGVFELIPDNIPVIGNLDEAGAVLVLVNCLRFYGIDVAGWFRRPTEDRRSPPDGQ